MNGRENAYNGAPRSVCTSLGFWCRGPMEEIQFHARCEFYALENWGCIGLQEPRTSNNQRHISNGAVKR
jgi:hypothetical protein